MGNSVQPSATNNNAFLNYLGAVKAEKATNEPQLGEIDDSFDDMYGSVSDAKRSTLSMKPPTLSRWDIEDMLQEEKKK